MTRDKSNESSAKSLTAKKAKDSVSAPSTARPSTSSFEIMKYVESLHEEAVRGDYHVTRFKKSITGVRLYDPWAEAVCIHVNDHGYKCKKGYKKVPDLRRHYVDAHGLDFGDAPIPATKMAMDEFKEFGTRGLQTSSKCGICQERGVRDMVEHLTMNHVDPRFMRHECKVEACKKKFSLLGQLKAHEQSHEIAAVN